MQRGRVAHVAILLTPRFSFFVFTVCGFVGGAEDPYAALRTTALFEAVYGELAAQGGGPAIIATDMNADVPNIEFVQHTLLGTEKRLDVEGSAFLWGQPPGQGTCLTANSRSKKRRDYLFVHPAIVPYVTDWKVVDDGTFPVHARIVLTLSIDAQPFRARTALTLPSLHDAKPEATLSDKQWRQVVCNAVAAVFEQN